MIGFGNFIKLKGNALAEEKRKDFKNIVILQVLVIVSAAILKDLLDVCNICSKETSYIFRDSLFFIFIAIYIVVLWDLLKDFTQNKVLLNTLIIIIIFTFIPGVITVNPFHKIFNEEDSRPYLFFIHSVLFLVETLVVIFAIFDIFSGNKLSKEKLWGSACIYLMIALGFGSLFDLVCIIHPGSLGIEMPLGLESYSNCIAYSMSIIGGQDPAYENASGLIKNIGIIESVWGNLFVVLLVGRLLGQPDTIILKNKI